MTDIMETVAELRRLLNASNPNAMWTVSSSDLGESVSPLIQAMRNNLGALLDYIERMQSAVIAEVGKDFGHATGQHEGALHQIMFPMHDRTNAGLLVASINRLRDALRGERKEAMGQC